MHYVFSATDPLSSIEKMSLFLDNEHKGNHFMLHFDLFCFILTLARCLLLSVFRRIVVNTRLNEHLLTYAHTHHHTYKYTRSSRRGNTLTSGCTSRLDCTLLLVLLFKRLVRYEQVVRVHVATKNRSLPISKEGFEDMGILWYATTDRNGVWSLHLPSQTKIRMQANLLSTCVGKNLDANQTFFWAFFSRNHIRRRAD